MKFRLLPTILVFAACVFAAGNGHAQDTTSEKGKASYALGYRAGLDIAKVLETGESLDMDTVIKGLHDAAAKKNPPVPVEQLGAALQALQGRMTARARADLEARAAKNKTLGEAFLAQNAAKPGVKTLPSGVQYRVIEPGNGAKPTDANQITVEFRSTLPDGTVVADTSMASEGQPAGPVTVRLSEIPLPGLREAVQAMPSGARWEIVLPGASAHGTSIDRAGQMANQVVLFTLKLLNVGPVVPKP